MDELRKRQQPLARIKIRVKNFEKRMELLFLLGFQCFLDSGSVHYLVLGGIIARRAREPLLAGVTYGVTVVDKNLIPL
jgi:hypothetical protein